MLRFLARAARAPLAMAFLSLALAGPLAAADRKIVTIPDADYFGGDYRTVKDVDLPACEAACIGDSQCQAFTYNTSARWCFLKNTQGEVQAFRGAIAGRIVAGQTRTVNVAAERKADLAFVPKYILDEAQRYALALPRLTEAPADSAAVLRKRAGEALAAGLAEDAERDYAGLVTLDGAESAAWAGLAAAQLQQNPDDWNRRTELRQNAVSAAVNAYLTSQSEGGRLKALELLADAMAANENWKPVIKALRLALTLNASPALKERYDQVMAEHGFRIVNHQVDADAAEPRICVVFSEELPRGEDLSPFVRVTGEPGTAVSSDGSQLCVTGVRHGARYDVTVRAGVPSAEGEKLEASADLTLYVRDRSPSVNFLGRAYVLPRGKDATIPIVSVNTTEVAAEIFRVGDRGLVDVVRDERFLRQLAPYESDQLADELGEKIWSGVVTTASPLNTDVTTAIPLEDIGLDLKPGVYAMTARSKLDRQNEWGARATQWFIVSDIGLAAYSGPDGVVASLRSLSTATALEGVPVRLVAVNNEILGEAVSDAAGLATFAPGLTRGRGGRAPALVIAETGDGDYSFLDLRKPAFDLSDRGVEGRAAPGPLDVFAWTEKGIYKSGETVHAQALLRNGRADAQSDLPLTLVYERPDGVEHLRQLVTDAGLGGYAHDLDLAPGVQQGVWTLKVYLDPKGEPLAQKTFLVEDYQPERVDYTLVTTDKAFRFGAPAEVSLEGRFLYGAPASGQVLEGDIAVSPTRSMEPYPGFRFGLSDEALYPTRDALPEGLRTDEEGRLRFAVTLPQVSETSGLYTAELVTRLVEAGGRYVERRLEMPVLPGSPRVGVRPLFSDGVDEGGPADFEIIVIDGTGARQAATGLAWTLSRIETRYQWYRSDGNWAYEPVTTSERVATGKLDVTADAAARLSVPVKWGEYRLEVTLAGPQPAATSETFTAGWYVADAASETPDVLDVGLDKTSYRPGETAILRLKPQFDGIAVVNVFSDRLLSSAAVPVKAGEASVDVAVSEEWGAGAYITATLYRPMDLEAKRMPARALGLSWAQVEPGDRKLAVEIEAPASMRPRSTLETTVRIANLQPGDKAYLTLAAVDVGILNLTGFKTPDPAAWYFGQRRLGVELRDLYGQLIDRTAGTRGQVRSGGDGGSLLQAPPPDEEPVALFSGIVEVGADGRVPLSFEVPDFNGTLRLMAVAWTRTGVGSIERDVEVRDPVVLSASLPRFLAPGDTSRMLVEIDNVDGQTGEYRFVANIDGPVSLTGPAEQAVALEQGKRMELRLPIQAGEGTGDAVIELAITGPDGTSASKTLALGVRDTQPYLTSREVYALEPGNSLTVGASALQGLRPGTVTVALAAGGAAEIDVPGLLAALDRYPYGCTEQTTSRALPLLYLNDVAESVGLGSDDALRARVTKAIQDVLANQNSGGSFGLWNAYGASDTWLDAYVADFLVRAREKGYDVPETAYAAALDSLQNRIAYASDFTEGGEGIAYALYVLARTGRASIGDLRYYMDVKLADFATPLAKAQIAASLALYGEGERASSGFKAAIDGLPLERAGLFREDFGSPLRDGAGVLSYLAEARSPVPAAPVSAFVARQQAFTPVPSTQDMAWLLLAAREANEQAKSARLALDGEVQPGKLGWSFTGGEIAARDVTLANQGSSPTSVVLSVSGQPSEPQPAGGNGFNITRSFYDLDGNEIDPAAVPYNTRMAVVIEVEPLTETNGRLLVVDRLPGGVVIDNPRLVRSGDIGALDWLTTIDQPDHVEFRTDQFVVSIDQRNFGDPVLTFAYLARAVTPGSYVLPPASVEDMYQSDRGAITDTGRFEILGPTR
ncbi:alpha-2-macroglobulin family protein [Pannonibacter tanglangensis]|uniref:Alpha-2-macroglobulin n=1 Tax=Pannonibacter tanglangensis TaxID=2750084 RepID=A0ABW9ZCJ4_9HYPH|nr:alpha-2-macroglobulin family protein [Pannonibacter sp. XCT-34]NBN62558.1 alpha-2-macroglobulin [Pannonibacter sp. XCT-34]